MINLILLISVLVFIEVKRASSMQECLFGTYSIYKTNSPSSFADVSISAELGLQLYSDVDGYVWGVRFYKGSTQAVLFCDAQTRLGREPDISLKNFFFFCREDDSNIYGNIGDLHNFFILNIRICIL